MTFVELFAGVGGFRLGLEALGHQCVFASENDPFAQSTYLSNYGKMPMGDITEIKAEDIPSHNILTAGFPCQDFSIAGKRKGMKTERGKMFFNIIRVLEHHQPKYFILENVKGLLSHDRGETFKTIVQSLYELGYGVDYRVLNTKDFGLPQNRERIFIVGKRKQDILWRTHWPIPPKTPTRLRDILEDQVDKKYFINAKVLKAHSKRRKAWLDKYNGGKWSDRRGQGLIVSNPDDEYIGAIMTGVEFKGIRLKKVGNMGATNAQAQRIYSPDGLSCTLAGGGGGQGGKTGLYQVGDIIRRLTPRECARLQGFPESFKILVSDTQAYKQFGNSVTIQVVTAIAKALTQS